MFPINVSHIVSPIAYSFGFYPDLVGQRLVGGCLVRVSVHTVQYLDERQIYLSKKTSFTNGQFFAATMTSEIKKGTVKMTFDSEGGHFFRLRDLFLLMRAFSSCRKLLSSRGAFFFMGGLFPHGGLGFFSYKKNMRATPPPHPPPPHKISHSSLCVPLFFKISPPPFLYI